MVDRDALLKSIDLIAKSLPVGSEFDFAAAEAGVELKVLRIQKGRAGLGTRFLSRLLALTDRHGVPSALEADPTDEPGDPDTFELVRWYARLGYELDHLSDGGERVCMHRPPRTYRGGHKAILADYDLARGRDLSRDDFDNWLEDQHAKPRSVR